MLLYYSSPVTQNTRRLAESIGEDPRLSGVPVLSVQDVDAENLSPAPKVLFIPSYGGDKAHLVPRPIVSFLNSYEDRGTIVGVVGAGNRNFGVYFCQAAKVVASKLNVPVLGMAELAGMPGEIRAIQDSVVAALGR